jgi:uncharacterized protein YkwD
VARGKAAAIIIIILVALITAVVAVMFIRNISTTKENPSSNIDFKIINPENLLQGQQLTIHNDLTQYALQKINDDRIKFNLRPVEISHNKAAQAQAVDLLKTKYQNPSHWSTNGMKPYMLYSLYGGSGYVGQNIAVKGYDNNTIEKCKDQSIRCEKIDLYKEIEYAERSMIYNDSICCQNGHRDNILDKHHTHVSIGIAYDKYNYYMAYVQNFENNYILLNKSLIQTNKQMQLSGKILAKNYSLDTIAVYYDETPTHLIYEQNKDKNSYGLGKLIASVVKPPPLFSHYTQPTNYILIQAAKWSQNGQSIDVRFDLAPVIKIHGVYTVVTYLKDNENNRFPVTSYSVFAE